MCFNKDDLIREFQLEQDRSNCYFNLMYKTLQFTFLAVASFIVCAFSLYKEQVIINLIFSLIIPICCYVFGIMYAYNAYALTVSGKRAEILHSNIYAKKRLRTKKNYIVLLLGMWFPIERLHYCPMVFH